MSDDELERLYAAAEAAKVGGWHTVESLQKSTPWTGGPSESAQAAVEADRAFIASCSPSVVKALIDRARVAEARAERAEAMHADAVRFELRTRMAVESVLDEALGPEEEDGTGEGLAADVYLLATYRANAESRLAALEFGIKALADEWERFHYENSKPLVTLLSLSRELRALLNATDKGTTE